MIPRRSLWYRPPNAMMSSSKPQQTILIVFSMSPYPLHSSGLGLRYLPVLQYLAQRHILDIMIVDRPNSPPSLTVEPLRAYCRNLFLTGKSMSNVTPEWWEKIRTHLVSWLPWTPPSHCNVYHAERMANEMRRLTAGFQYDTLVCVGMSWHTPHVWGIAAARRIVDFCDSPTAFYKRNVASSKETLSLRYNAWKAKRYEIDLIRKSTATVYISLVDANALSPQEVGQGQRYVLPNGISTEAYSPDCAEPVRAPSIGFLGNMSYTPNVEAAAWLYQEVFLPLRRQIPTLSLYIIGRSPATSVRALGENVGVVVTGEVEQVWPWLNAVDLFVLPIFNGTGVKNKILEILHAKRAIVTTPLANEGINAVSGRDLVLGNSIADFQRETLRLLGAPAERARLGESGHRWVAKHFSWGAILEDFEAVITGRDIPARCCV